MKVQHNSMTKMFWSYIPTSIARRMGLKKGDEVELVMDEKTKKVEFKKMEKLDNNLKV